MPFLHPETSSDVRLYDVVTLPGLYDAVNFVSYWLLSTFYLPLPDRERVTESQCFTVAPIAAMCIRALSYPHTLYHKAPRIQNTTRIVLLADLLHQGSVLEVISPDVDPGF